MKNLKVKLLILALIISLGTNVWLGKNKLDSDNKISQATLNMQTGSLNAARNLEWLRDTIEEIENKKDYTREDLITIYSYLNDAANYSNLASNHYSFVNEQYKDQARTVGDLFFYIIEYKKLVRKILDSDLSDIDEKDLKKLYELRDIINKAEFPSNIPYNVDEWDEHDKMMKQLLTLFKKNVRIPFE